eukprot:TRINITY_DN2120_c0_g1_i1.p1 TRINITY_DN2120_c0_g1~~TRINITY_DN2120_c0_g1_i1.p1  ORF type:complete len:415 (-),score=82.94 TRINITY_DN2120_c0_g1_i1:8-1252(-)
MEMRQRVKSSKGPEDTTTKKNEVVAAAASEKEKKKKSIITRITVGCILMSGFIGILLTDHMIVSLFIVVLQVIVFKEVIALRYIENKEKNLWGFRTIHWFLLAATFFWFYGHYFIFHFRKYLPYAPELLQRSHIVISFSLYVIAFLGFIISLQFGGVYKYQLGQLAWTVLMLLNVVGQSHVIIANIFNGLFWLIVPSTLIICNDCAAYFWGMMIGKKFINRPLTSLSPNKTWEGFVGAAFTTVFFSLIISYVLAQFDWMRCPKEFEGENLFGKLHCVTPPEFLPAEFALPTWVSLALSYVGIHRQTIVMLPVQLHSVVFALFASLIAPFGGFFASAMKRAYGVKDFSALFPGHGGMTDRMDCQFIMGLFVYVYYTAFVRSSLYDYNTIAFSVQHLTEAEQLRLFESLGRSLGRV